MSDRCRFESDVRSTLQSGKQTEHPVIEWYTICCYVSTIFNALYCHRSGIERCATLCGPMGRKSGIATELLYRIYLRHLEQQQPKCSLRLNLYLPGLW